MKAVKTAHQLERHFKGVANHRRISLLVKIGACPDMSVEELAEAEKTNIKTVSEHLRRLVQAGLVNKRYEGRKVVHVASPYGHAFLAFIKTFQHS